MTTVQVVKTSDTVNNSPIQDYVHQDEQTQPTFEIFVLMNIQVSKSSQRVGVPMRFRNLAPHNLSYSYVRQLFSRI